MRGESGLLEIENSPIQRGLEPCGKLIRNMKNPSLPDLQRKSGCLFIPGVVEDANFADAALSWVESDRQVGHTAFVDTAKGGFTCRVTAAACASLHPFEVPVESVEGNIDHEAIEPERSRKSGLLKRDLAAQRCFH